MLPTARAPRLGAAGGDIALPEGGFDPHHRAPAARLDISFYRAAESLAGYREQRQHHHALDSAERTADDNRW